MLAQTPVLLALPTAAVAAAVAGVSFGAANTYSPDVGIAVPATVPSNASPKIDLSFPGFAFEESSFYLYATDIDGNPNTFSLALINDILDRTGGTPMLRIGGTSGDKGHYNASQQEPAVPNGRFNKPLWHTPFLSIGPSFFKAFASLPGCHFIPMIPLYQDNITNSLEFAAQAFANIPAGTIEAVEIGNEPDLYGGFSPAKYADQWTDFQQQLIDKFPWLGTTRFQGLDYAQDNGSLTTYLPEAFRSGINNTGLIRQVSYHYYESTDRTLYNLSDLQLHIVNHTRIKNHLHNYTSSIQALQQSSPGTPFILGEDGNSIPLTSNQTFSNILGTALWNIDFQLQAMTIGVTRVNMQQIFWPGYAMWQPQGDGLIPPGVNANFYSQPLVGDFIGKSNATRVTELSLTNLSNEAFMAGYAAYDGDALASIVLINMKLWSALETDEPRGSARITLTDLPQGCIDVRWMNAQDGAYANTTLHYNGLQWTYPSGKPEQVIHDGSTVCLQGSELVVLLEDTAAVLLNFNNVRPA